VTRGGLLQRLQNGRPADHRYAQGPLRGLVSAWRHEGRFVLTWEESRSGDQHNEHAYTRDERHLFTTAEELVAFVEQQGLTAEDFRP
jgi:hypothetical protein